MDDQLKKYTEAWHGLNGDNDDHFRITLAGEICRILAERGAYEKMDAFITKEIVNTDGYFDNEKFAINVIKLAIHKNDFTRAYKLIKDGRFAGKSRMIRLWDGAHYKEIELRTKRTLTSLDRFRIRQRYLPPGSILPHGVRPKVTINSKSRRVLSNWLHEHEKHPFPSKKEIRELYKLSRLSSTQVRNWFVNVRRCMRKQGRLPKRQPNVHAKQICRTERVDSSTMEYKDTGSAVLSPHVDAAKSDANCNGINIDVSYNISKGGDIAGTLAPVEKLLGSSSESSQKQEVSPVGKKIVEIGSCVGEGIWHEENHQRPLLLKPEPITSTKYGHYNIDETVCRNAGLLSLTQQLSGNDFETPSLSDSPLIIGAPQDVTDPICLGANSPLVPLPTFSQNMTMGTISFFVPSVNDVTLLDRTAHASAECWPSLSTLTYLPTAEVSNDNISSVSTPKSLGTPPKNVELFKLQMVQNINPLQDPTENFSSSSSGSCPVQQVLGATDAELLASFILPPLAPSDTGGSHVFINDPGDSSSSQLYLGDPISQLSSGGPHSQLSSGDPCSQLSSSDPCSQLSSGGPCSQVVSCDLGFQLGSCDPDSQNSPCTPGSQLSLNDQDIYHPASASGPGAQLDFADMTVNQIQTGNLSSQSSYGHTDWQRNFSHPCSDLICPQLQFPGGTSVQLPQGRTEAEGISIAAQLPFSDDGDQSSTGGTPFQFHSNEKEVKSNCLGTIESLYGGVNSTTQELHDNSNDKDSHLREAAAMALIELHHSPPGRDILNRNVLL
ncbi:PREDICTED: uncharacterized protein LOC106808522 [Priapulus caudatus]|uniref:Uncharacterized protein LOC106808522 n=1 Tax=Priapulus caudatus TaxID=37621 RepID=A0ABM1E3J7_PRICU|nr:PREDICTED: uncharacterized protein LOC106808522 [Priapulus caudatus]